MTRTQDIETVREGKIRELLFMFWQACGDSSDGDARDRAIEETVIELAALLGNE